MLKTINNIFDRYRTFILLVMVLLAVTVASYMIIIPKIKGIFEKKQIIEADKVLLITLVNKRKMLDSMSGGENLQFFEDAQIALPNEKDAAGILMALDNLVTQTQFAVERINLTPGMLSSKSGTVTDETQKNVVEKNKGANFLKIQLSAKGKTANFMDFIKKLVQIRPLFDIYEISVDYEPNDPDILKANLFLNAYYLTAIKQIGSLESALPELLPKEKETLISLRNFPYFGNISDENTTNIPVGKSDLFVP